MSSQKTLKINPELFKLNGKSHKEKSSKIKPKVDKSEIENTNKVKKELLKKVKDYQKKKKKNELKMKKVIYLQIIIYLKKMILKIMILRENSINL